MNIHKNARLTPSGRERVVLQIESGQTPDAVSQAAGVCPRTVRKWVDRYRREGVAGLKDRSSRPHRLYRPTPQAIVEQVERLRRLRFTGKQIAAELSVSPATVSRILKRLGLNRIGALEPAVPVRRYERERPGELIHIDIKKLGRFARAGHRATGQRQGCRNEGAGWEFVHVAIDDHSRLAFAKVMANKRSVAPPPSSRPRSPTTQASQYQALDVVARKRTSGAGPTEDTSICCMAALHGQRDEWRGRVS